MAQTVRRLTCVREVPGSNLDKDTDYTYKYFVITAVLAWQAATAAFHILSDSLFTIIQPFGALYS